MRLIDADSLKITIDYTSFETGYDAEKVIKAIDEEPTIEPVKRGKWLVMTTFDNMDRFKDYELECSCCHAIYRAKFFSFIEDWYKYCPHCGVKIGGDD